MTQKEIEEFVAEIFSATLECSGFASLCFLLCLSGGAFTHGVAGLGGRMFVCFPFGFKEKTGCTQCIVSDCLWNFVCISSHAL